MCCTPGPDWSEPLSYLGEEAAYQVKEGVAEVQLPSLVGVVEVVEEAYLDHRELVVAEVAFQAREEVEGGH